MPANLWKLLKFFSPLCILQYQLIFILKLFNKSKSFFNASYLILISLLAVNYRTISMVEEYFIFSKHLYIAYF